MEQPDPHAQHPRAMRCGRRAVLAAAPAVLLPAAARGGAGQPGAAGLVWPTRPVRIYAGSAAGGSLDATARILANALAPRLGQSFVVENRGGAGGSLTFEPVMRAAPDGHALTLNNSGALVVNPLLQANPAVQPFEDLAPVALASEVLTVLVTPADRPWQRLEDLVAAARARPGELSWGHPGVGSSPWLAALLLDRMAELRTISVPYRGGGPAMLDLLAGRLDYMFATTPTALPHVQAGRLRALAVPTPQRLPFLASVPTVAELGYAGFELRGWFGILTTKGTPRPIIERLHGAINEALRDPASVAQLAEQGMSPLLAESPDAFARYAAEERERWGPLARAAAAREAAAQ